MSVAAAAVRPDEYSIQRSLQRARRRRKLSRYKLAKLADLQASTIQRIEEGTIQNPSIETLTKLETALGLRFGSLLNGRV